MNTTGHQAAAFDSVYPDFLRTGLGKLGELDSRRELVSLFSALEHFRHDLHQQDDPHGVLAVTHRYVAGLGLFGAMGFWMVNPQDMDFQLALAAPQTESALLERTVKDQIKAGRFALALRRGAPVIFESASGPNPQRGMLHGMTLSSQAVGMFCGMLKGEATAATDVAHSLLSLLLGESADAIATQRKTKELTTEVETLSGLLPLCAWCKKVRNDSGYWEQIDHYLTAHSHAHLTHGVCPDCKQSFLMGAGKK
jgi:hypothetical protein